MKWEEGEELLLADELPTIHHPVGPSFTVRRVCPHQRVGSLVSQVVVPAAYLVHLHSAFWGSVITSSGFA